MRRFLHHPLAKLVVFGAFSLVLVEVLFRCWVAFEMGPSILVYGTPFDHSMKEVRTWDELARLDDPDKVRRGGYAKFPPGFAKHMNLSDGTRMPIRINNHGFRGADFAVEKAPGIVRVIVLGASSTFGFFVRDHETYPACMERILNERLKREPIAGVRAFEVLNFGIPHLHSDEIRNLFEDEGVALRPDFVTFYEGVNDTRRLERSAHQKAFVALARRVLTCRFVLESLWNVYENFSDADLRHHRRGKAEAFLANVDAIARLCGASKATFLAVSQQAASLAFPREELRGMSSAEERDRLLARMQQRGRVGGYELAYLLHCELMDALRAFASEAGFGFVDAARVFDERGRRDCVITWVHLSPEGNRILADVIAGAIWSRLQAQ